MIERDIIQDFSDLQIVKSSKTLDSEEVFIKHALKM